MNNQVLLTIARYSGDDVTDFQQIFNPADMKGVKLNSAGTAIEFRYDAGDGKGPQTYLTTALTLADLQNSMNTASAGGNQVFIGRINSTSGFGIGAHDVLDANGNAIVIKDNSRVWAGFYEVITTFTSATDAATISLDIATDDVAGLKAATAISTGTTYDATGAPVLLIPQQSVGTISEKTTGDRKLQYTVAIEAVTAGAMIVFIEVINEGL